MSAQQNQKPQVIKVKVKPYPFAATLEKEGAKLQVSVVYVSPKGILAVMGPQFVHVGDYHQIIFELPVLGEFINTQVRVLKTYDRSLDGHKVERMAEFHFQKLSDEHKNRIVQFMAAIKQTK
jgi:hypothetical protein